MPRRNLLILFLVAVLAAILCRQRVHNNPYTHVLAEAMTTMRIVPSIRSAIRNCLKGPCTECSANWMRIPPTSLPRT